MRILLTGGSGMVGKNILEHPASRHHELLAPSSREMNLLDRTSTFEFVQKTKPDLIIHCAGRVGGIQANMAHPVAFLIENLDMARNVIGAAAEVGVPKLLNMGSSCMYPRNAPNPLTEDLVLKGELEPTNEGYAIAKVFAARFGSYLMRERKELQYKTLIPCNLYGRHDKFDPKHSHLIPAVIHKVHTAKKESEPHVEIWGDGEARREFMDAADLADFVYFALDRFQELPELTNVGLGFDHSINDYYRAVAKVIGYTGPFKHDLTKPVGMKQKLVSVDQAARMGWKASTSLEAGIKKAYDFYLGLQEK
ncbi:MAG: GDP-L-fucose synthase [Bdellovibrionaceae bacterium]|nr:GDP-L-fucose synthase [Pseudobdellovibrionaceae bacterium]